MKGVIWFSAFLGSVIGGALPLLWGSSMLSVSGILLSGVGGIAGLYAGYKFWKHFWG